MSIDKIIKGGFLAGHRTYIISGMGILSAACAYLLGDSDLFETLQTAFMLGGIYFLRKSGENKRKENGEDSGKISE
ncbi:MAG: hypothetical protein LBD50_02655 [Rickettsiales bacterium]|jgi:hypothetical protein|nr:hypothetical protein [Rickettsiales bacterium]